MSQILTYIITYFIEGTIAYTYFNFVYQSRIKFSKVILTTSIFYFLQFLLSFAHNFVLNGASFLVFNLLILLICFDVSIGSAVFNTIMMTILMTTTELITGNIIGAVFPFFDVADMRNELFVLYLFICKSMYIFTLYILAKLINIYKEPRMVYTLENILLAFIPILSFVILIILFYICSSNILPRLHEILVVSCSFCLIAVNILVFWVQNYSNSKHQEMLRLQENLQMEADEAHYYKMLENHDAEQRILIHDIKNHLTAISLMAQNNKSSDIENYIKKLESTPALNTNFVQTKNTYFNMLMSRYVSLCQSKHIRLHTDTQTCNIDYLEPEEITALFSNLMDNAVSAAEMTDDPFIDIRVSEKGDTNTIISIDNSCNIAPIFDSSHLPHTTKPDALHHGIGTKSIQKIVESHNGNIMYSYDESTREYHTILNMFH